MDITYDSMLERYLNDLERELLETPPFAQQDNEECKDIAVNHFKDISKAQERKDTPVFSGVLAYFPDALRAVSRASKAGNDQHGNGPELHWDRSKSGDELDALTRHLLEAGTMDDDGIRHSTKIAWRSLANLQKEIERYEK